MRGEAMATVFDRYDETGVPLPGPLAVRMARFFGHDLASVRLHVSRVPRLLGARAFTGGEHIFVDPDHHAPDTVGGRQLIAHELAHVLQQRLRRVPAAPRAQGWSLVDDPALEEEADRLGWRAALGLDPEDGVPNAPVPTGPSPRLLQCALADTSIPTTLAMLTRLFREEPATATLGGIGRTSHPENGRAPAYDAQVARVGERPSRYIARLVITSPPYEGDSTSHYLRAGVYETNFRFDMATFLSEPGATQLADCLRPFEQRKDAPPNRVYYVVPDAIADLNRNAELEHCRDHRYAYDQTLAVIHAALQRAQGRETAPAVNAATARTMLECGLLNEIPEARRFLGVDMANWLTEYERLCESSRNRDVREYHRFGLELIEPADVPAGEINYLTGRARDEDGHDRVYLRFTAGGTQINVHDSSAIVI